MFDAQDQSFGMRGSPSDKKAAPEGISTAKVPFSLRVPLRTIAIFFIYIRTGLCDCLIPKGNQKKHDIACIRKPDDEWEVH